MSRGEYAGGRRRRKRHQSVGDRGVGASIAGINALAERREFSARYKSGQVLLHADRLAVDGARALNYQDANLRDAVLRVGLDDLYEDPHRALKVRRCQEKACKELFFANRGGQLYCSHRCATNAAARAYRRRRGTRNSPGLPASDRHMETQ